MYENNNVEHPKVISFGYRCTAAAILKRLNLKHESYPFDWLISRLSVIEHCISTDFDEFLNLDNYTRKYSNTYEMADSTNGFICDEHLMINTYYQPADCPDVDNTYQYYLAMNHHNIVEPKDTEYYTRCVDRMREQLASTNKKLYIHIAPLITIEKYNDNKSTIIADFLKFDEFIYNASNYTTQGLFIVMVRENIEYPRCEFYGENTENGTKIYIIYANARLIDAGEIYMGNYSNENKMISDLIREQYEKLDGV